MVNSDSQKTVEAHAQDLARQAAMKGDPATVSDWQQTRGTAPTSYQPHLTCLYADFSLCVPASSAQATDRSAGAPHIHNNTHTNKLSNN